MTKDKDAKIIIRVGSRASRLAVLQSEIVMRQIEEACPGVRTELVTMKTKGDRILDKASRVGRGLVGDYLCDFA